MMISTHKKQWYAVYTKYKAEKLVAEMLQSKEIEAYTPLLKKVKKYSKKVKTHFYPLINNYTFVRINERERTTVLQTNHVIGFLKLGGKYIPIPDEEINILKRVVGEKFEVEAIPSVENIGESVEIIQGSLTGLSGQLISVLNKSEFIIQLNQLGYQLKIGIHPKFLMRIPALV